MLGRKEELDLDHNAINKISLHIKFDTKIFLGNMFCSWHTITFFVRLKKIALKYKVYNMSPPNLVPIASHMGIAYKFQHAPIDPVIDFQD